MTKPAVVAGSKGLVPGIYDLDSRQISQEQAGYEPYGSDAGKGCAACQWFVPSGDACILVAGDIVATGKSKYFMPKVPKSAVPLLVKVVEDETLTVQSQVTSKEGGEGLFSKFKSWLNDMLSDPDDMRATFSVFRTKEGDLRFMLVYSNVFKDSHKEIIETAAHKEYAEWVTKTGHYPELQLWHCGPGTAIGKGDFVDFVDGFAVGSGVIYKDKEHVAEKLAAQDTGVSQGFLGTWKEDVCIQYRPFEWTLLPAHAAANSWTDFRLHAKELAMPFSDAKRAFLKQVGYDDPAIDGFQESLKTFGEKLVAAGVQYKEAGSDAAPVTVVNVSAPVPAGTVVPQATPQVQAVAVAPDSELATTVLVKELLAGQKARDEVIVQLAESLKGVSAQIKQMQKPIEDQFTDMLTAKIDKLPQGHQASAAATNVVVKEDANPDFDWFFQSVIDPLKNSAQAAATGVPVAVGVN